MRGKQCILSHEIKILKAEVWNIEMPLTTENGHILQLLTITFGQISHNYMKHYLLCKIIISLHLLIFYLDSFTVDLIFKNSNCLSFFLFWFIQSVCIKNRCVKMHRNIWYATKLHIFCHISILKEFKGKNSDLQLQKKI